MRDRGIGRWIEHRAEITPDHTAVVYADTQRSYAELAARVRRLANALRALGVQQGDRIGWLGANHPAFLELLFAGATVGAVMAPVNHHLDPETIRSLLEDLSPRVVAVGEPASDLSTLVTPGARVAITAPASATSEYELLVESAADEPLEGGASLDDLCMLPHTSGTTGEPKAVMLTHGNVTWNVVNFLSAADFLGDDVTIAVAPFFRAGGTGTNVLPVLFKGGTVVIPRSSDPGDLLHLIEEHRVTIGFGNPDLLTALTRSSRWASTDLSSVRMFMTGGAPVPDHLVRAYLDRGVTFVQGYGLTEAGPLALLLDRHCARAKIGSAGKPPVFVDVRIVRAVDSDCAPDETGELLVRGPNVMRGYWENPEATREVLDERGWLHTGDAARVDGDGYVWIVGRVEDAYVVDGQTVHPGDIERVLEEDPRVVEAGVVAASGRSAAFVVLAAGASVQPDELLELCRSRLAPHEMPETLVFVEQLPRSSVGKLLRHDLAQRIGADPPARES